MHGHGPDDHADHLSIGKSDREKPNAHGDRKLAAGVGGIAQQPNERDGFEQQQDAQNGKGKSATGFAPCVPLSRCPTCRPRSVPPPLGNLIKRNSR